MVGIGISHEQPPGFRDYGKILVGIAGLKNRIGDLCNTSLFYPRFISFRAEFVTFRHKRC